MRKYGMLIFCHEHYDFVYFRQKLDNPYCHIIGQAILSEGINCDIKAGASLRPVTQELHALYMLAGLYAIWLVA